MVKSQNPQAAATRLIFRSRLQYNFPEYLEFLIFLQFFRMSCIACAVHAIDRSSVEPWQHNNFLKLHCHRQDKIVHVAAA